MADSNKLILNLLDVLHKTDRNSPLTANMILAKLKSSEYGNSTYRQRIYELISILVDNGYPIKLCENKNDGFYMEKHDFKDWQLKIMLDAVTQSACFSEEDTAQIRRNLLNLTSSRGRRKILSVYSPEKRVSSENSISGDYLDSILEACYLGRKVNFQYSKLDKNMNPFLCKNGAFYELSVFAIYHDETFCYIIGGHDHHKPFLTNYRLDRMLNVSISEDKMTDKKVFLNTDNPDYAIQEYIEKEVNHYAGEIINLEVEFDPSDEIAMGILVDFAGKKIKVRYMNNGLARVCIRKHKSPNLMGWVMTNARRIKVIEPKSYVSEIRDNIKEMGKIYQK